MTNSVMSEDRKIRLGWKKVYIAVLWIFVVYLAYRAYHFGMNQVMLTEQNKLQDDIAAKNTEIQKAYASTDYTTYLAGKKLIVARNSGSWLDRISRVIQIFTTLQSLGGGNVQFSDFKIDYDRISLKGTVPNLSYIYAKDGVIDQFVGLDFITNVAIQDYKKNGDVFAFTLTADISLNGTGSSK